MKRHSLKELDAMLGPVRVARSRAVAQRRIEAMLLSQVRKQLGFTQTHVARNMGVSQSALSQLESQDDMQLSTLRRMIHAMGGDLDVVLRFGNRSVVLTNPK